MGCVQCAQAASPAPVSKSSSPAQAPDVPLIPNPLRPPSLVATGDVQNIGPLGQSRLDSIVEPVEDAPASHVFVNYDDEVHAEQARNAVMAGSSVRVDNTAVTSNDSSLQTAIMSVDRAGDDVAASSIVGRRPTLHSVASTLLRLHDVAQLSVPIPTADPDPFLDWMQEQEQQAHRSSFTDVASFKSTGSHRSSARFSRAGSQHLSVYSGQLSSRSSLMVYSGGVGGGARLSTSSGSTQVSYRRLPRPSGASSRGSLGSALALRGAASESTTSFEGEVMEDLSVNVADGEIGVGEEKKKERSLGHCTPTRAATPTATPAATMQGPSPSSLEVSSTAPLDRMTTTAFLTATN